MEADGVYVRHHPANSSPGKRAPGRGAQGADLVDWIALAGVDGCKAHLSDLGQRSSTRSTEYTLLAPRSRAL